MMDERQTGLFSRWTGHGWTSIWAKNVSVGRGCELHSDIGSANNICEDVVLGDCVYIGPGCNIQVPSLSVGDYTKIHRNSLLYGRNPLSIGHNCWFGEGTIIDAEGTTVIGNGVGAGAYSQLWSHIRHGDLMIGCQYHGFSKLTVSDDCWFVGHCVVSPIFAGPRSMALVGSVVTRDMQENHIYGGAPAKDLTDKLGPPFKETTQAERMALMESRLAAFSPGNQHGDAIRIVAEWEADQAGVTQFNVMTREYTKKGTLMEVAFMKTLLPEIKFIPRVQS